MLYYDNFSFGNFSPAVVRTISLEATQNSDCIKRLRQNRLKTST